MRMRMGSIFINNEKGADGPFLFQYTLEPSGTDAGRSVGSEAT